MRLLWLLETQARKALLKMLLYVLGHFLIALLAPLVGHARSDVERLLLSKCGEDGRTSCTNCASNLR
jgi:hypothetical protein